MNRNDPLNQIPPKSSKQVLIHKMKHISQIDKEIRRNWKNLYKIMNKDRINPEETPNQRVQTECIQSKNFKKTNNKNINSVHSQLKREKVHERHRKNQQIFFKKRPYEGTNGFTETKKNRGIDTGFNLSRRYSLQIQNSQKKLEQSIPFMLRKRSAKVEKQMGIISHFYKDSLQKIKTKQELKHSLNFKDRINLINSMKGTKVYYRFLKQWRSNEQETI